MNHVSNLAFWMDFGLQIYKKNDEVIHRWTCGWHVRQEEAWRWNSEWIGDVEYLILNVFICLQIIFHLWMYPTPNISSFSKNQCFIESDPVSESHTQLNIFKLPVLAKLSSRTPWYFIGGGYSFKLLGWNPFVSERVLTITGRGFNPWLSLVQAFPQIWNT